MSASHIALPTGILIIDTLIRIALGYLAHQPQCAKEASSLGRIINN